ncbi:MAG: RNA polymerase sigma-70 factor [Tannerellaceae bacterium]|jgi:RNA polymerase sigma-70 factor (ECF subfamily)|nr:RNA polymerase sigma-70 factor [Tannerellaceae bacterium]
MLREQENKDAVFSEMYVRYYPKLLRFSKFYVLSEEDSENIIQDIFTEMWTQMELLKGIRNMDAYLFALVKNRCIDYLRNQVAIYEKKRNLQDVTGKELEFKLYSLQQVDEMLFVDDVEKLLQSAINKLPKRCREVFLLSRSEGLKNREISERLQISVSTVENQMTIAIRKLKSELKDYLPVLLFFI